MTETPFDLEKEIDPENNELTQRLHRLSESWQAEREDHKGRCRTLDILLGTDGPWLFDYLYRCANTIKKMNAALESERAKAEGLVEAAEEVIRTEDHLANEQFKFLKGFAYRKEMAVTSVRHHVLALKAALAHYRKEKKG